MAMTRRQALAALFALPAALVAAPEGEEVPEAVREAFDFISKRAYTTVDVSSSDPAAGGFLMPDGFARQIREHMLEHAVLEANNVRS